MLRGIKVSTKVDISFDEAKEVCGENRARLALIISNAGPNTVYLGADNQVTESDGLPLASGATLVDEWSLDAWYAIASPGESASLRVVEIR